MVNSLVVLVVLHYYLICFPGGQSYGGGKGYGGGEGYGKGTTVEN